MPKVIGIDLGTTNSVIAVADGPQPRILDNRDNQPQMRSIVSLKKRRGREGQEGDPEFLVGRPAFDNWPMAPKDTIVSVKRLMGRAMADPQVELVRKQFSYEIREPSRGTRDSVRVVMGGKEYSPIEISAMILEALKDAAEYRLRDEITHAVITVPAYFSQVQKAATREAGERAGIRVLKILDEPTAAAIAFGIEAGAAEEPKWVLVYDLGGGTFDISVLMVHGGVFAPVNLEGDMWLGGDDMDGVLVDRAVAHVREEFGIDPTGNHRFMVELKKAAQRTKEALSSARSADLVVAGQLQDPSGDLLDVEIEVTREEYERMIRPLVERTVTLTKKAVENANLTLDQIDYVLMAGNSTSVPLVQQAMEELFGAERVIRHIHPKHSVALGAAIVAARLGGVVCQAPSLADPERECGHLNELNATACASCGATLALAPTPVHSGEIQLGDLLGIAPYHYGAQTAGDRFAVFVQKSDPYPTLERQSQTFYTRRPDQRMISIPVYGGDDLERASANEKQGEAFAILPPGLPEGTPVRISIWLDADGIFDLSARLENGTDLKPWILHGEEDARAVEAIEEVEQTLAAKADVVSLEERLKLEAARNRAFQRLQQRDYAGALREAEELQQMAQEAGAAGGDELREKAESLLAFAEFLLRQYGWALDSAQTERVRALVEETKAALTQDERRTLEQKVRDLDAATDQLPELVRLLLGMRGAVAARVRPSDPALAQELMRELEEVESLLRSGDSYAQVRLLAVAQRISEAMEREGPRVQATCPDCGTEMAPGARHCPRGHDTWLVGTSFPR